MMQGTEEHTTRFRIGYVDTSRLNFCVCNLPPLVLKTRHLSDSARFYRPEEPEQAQDEIPPGMGLVVKVV